LFKGGREEGGVVRGVIGSVVRDNRIRRRLILKEGRGSMVRRR